VNTSRALASVARGAAAASVAVALACGSSQAPPGDTGNPGHGGDDATTGSDDASGANPTPDGGASSSPDGASPCDTDAPWSDPGAATPATDPAAAGKTHRFFKIAVLDKSSAPVVGATLTTTNDVVYTTDTNGNVAYYEPGLMGTDVWFTPACGGYTAATDGLGNAGAALHPVEGGSGALTMTRSGTVTPPAVGDLQTRLLAGAVPGASQCFALRTVDSVTGRGVPLVELATSAGDAYWSDSQGMIAYCDPDAIGKKVTFTVTADGYALATGTSVTAATVAGGSQTVDVVRELPGQRLYRVTGQGSYRDSTLLGLTTPVANPNVNGLVMGQDTPSTFVFGGKVYWLWQDTGRAAYPLGNFASSGATSAFPADGGLSPDLGVNATYFVGTDGFSRGMVDTTGDPLLKAGSSAPVWLGQVAVVLDPQSQPHAFGRYYVAASSNPWSALSELDASTSKFTFVADFPSGAPLPSGRSTIVNDTSGPHAYWGNPVRFPATVSGIENVGGYDVYTAYSAKGSTTLARNADGTLAYAWQAGGSIVTQAALTTAKVPLDQALDGHLTDVVGGGGVQVANGPGISAFGSSSMWNDYRKRYSEVIQQEYGQSFLGESWYAEGDTPLGPWVFTRKVVTHGTTGYTFYNPDIMPMLSEAGGRIVFFDATYTRAYTNLSPTPRYDYNEIMYRIDLDDPAMALPVAIYARASGAQTELVAKSGVRPGDAAMAPSFFAYDRPAPGAVPLAWNGPSCGPRRLVAGGQPATTPLFYALPAGAADAGAGPAAVPLYEYAGASGAYAYGVDANLALAGFQRGAAVARVWPTPVRVALPVADFLGDLVADAGPDQCVTAASGGSAQVSLDASATRDLAGPATSYTWTLNGASCPFATGSKAEVTLPPGVSDVRLRVTDAAGNTSSDDVLVNVGP
jgi:hypothetical protein